MADQTFEMFLFAAPDARCAVCGSTEYVNTVGPAKAPAYCVVCFYIALDVAMGWNVSGTALQGLAIRKASLLISDEKAAIRERVDQAIGGKRKGR